MSLTPLIKNQTLRIDNHQWGTQLPNDWKDLNQDIHIDKEIKNYKYNGKKVNVRIKIPLNSQKPITCDINGTKFKEIPKDIFNEIQRALSDPAIRQPFTDDLVDILKGYDKVMASKENAEQALERIAGHFKLSWTKKEITTFINDKLAAITRIYNDGTNKLYFITFKQLQIIIGDIDMWSKHEIRLNKLS